MPTYRSDVIGSLLRPGYLKEARKQHEAGTLDNAAFKQIEDRAVNEAIALQTGAGLDVITDGEMRRYAFYGHFIDAVEGYDKYGGWAIPFRDEEGHELVLQRPVVVSRLKRLRPMCMEEFTYLRARAGRPDQGHADQRPAGGGLLRCRQIEGRLRDHRGLPGRRGGHPARRGRRAGAPGLRLHPD